MATLVLTNALFEVNATDLSAAVASLTLNLSSETVDETAMGDDTRVRKGGLKTWDVDATLHQDFAAGQVDPTLFSLVGTTVCAEIRPVNACSSANNPIFSGIAILQSYPPVGGAIGDLLDTTIRLESAGTLNRASSS